MPSIREPGQITKYNKDRGFGFIESEERAEQLWFHFTYLEGGEDSSLYDLLNNNPELMPLDVTFEVRKDYRGMQAYKIRLSEEDRPYNSSRRLFEGVSLDEFLKKASFPLLAPVDKDLKFREEIIQIINSRTTWDKISVFAGEWVEVLRSIKLNPYSIPKDLFTSFLTNLSNVLHLPFELNSEQLIPNISALKVKISNLQSPFRSLCDLSEFSIVIFPDIRYLEKVLRNNAADLMLRSPSVVIVILLDEQNLADKGTFIPGLYILRQETILRAILDNGLEAPVIIGRIFRSMFPEYLQPYAISAEFNEGMFVGRGKELNRILSDNNNYAIYGGRRIGKTWFLQKVCKKCEAEPFASRFSATYVSLQSLSVIEDSISIITDKLCYQYNLIPSEAKDPYEKLRNTLLKAHKASKKVILLALDEIDETIVHDKDNRFFGVLRQFQQTYIGAIKYIFAGFTNLMHAFYYVDARNPFANWIDSSHHFPLMCLPEEDLEDLVVSPLKWVGLEFEPNEITTEVYKATSGHPYYAQLLCQKVVGNRLSQGYRKLSIQNIQRTVKEDFTNEVFDTFKMNLTPLQVLIGKLFATQDKPFVDEEILLALSTNFDIKLTMKSLKEEMTILCACSIFARIQDGYVPVLQSINEEFFKNQDEIDIALKALENLNGN